MSSSILINPYSFAAGGVSDSDAIAFLAAASITDPTISSAVDALVIGLKADSLWSAKLQVIYPFVGGTGATHKYNLKDPQDTDGAFRITFSGGWTHASTGALPNGSDYGDTHFVPSTSSTVQDTHVSVYLRTNTAAGNKADIGAYTSGAETTLLILARNTGDVMAGDSYDYSSARLTSANSDSRGHFIENRTSLTVHNIWKNGSKLATQTSGNSGLPSTNVFISGAQSAALLSDREVAFATIGTGLSDGDAANLYSRIQTFQTALSRNV